MLACLWVLESCVIVGHCVVPQRDGKCSGTYFSCLLACFLELIDGLAVTFPTGVLGILPAVGWAMEVCTLGILVIRSDTQFR